MRRRSQTYCLESSAGSRRSQTAIAWALAWVAVVVFSSTSVRAQGDISDVPASSSIDGADPIDAVPADPSDVVAPTDDEEQRSSPTRAPLDAAAERSEAEDVEAPPALDGGHTAPAPRTSEPAPGAADDEAAPPPPDDADVAADATLTWLGVAASASTTAAGVLVGLVAAVLPFSLGGPVFALGAALVGAPFVVLALTLSLGAGLGSALWVPWWASPIVAVAALGGVVAAEVLVVFPALLAVLMATQFYVANPRVQVSWVPMPSRFAALQIFFIGGAMLQIPAAILVATATGTTAAMLSLVGDEGAEMMRLMGVGAPVGASERE